MFKRLHRCQLSKGWLPYLMMALVIVGTNSGIARAQDQDYFQIHEYEFTVDDQPQQGITTPPWLRWYHQEPLEREVYRRDQHWNNAMQETQKIADAAVRKNGFALFKALTDHFREIGFSFNQYGFDRDTHIQETGHISSHYSTTQPEYSNHNHNYTVEYHPSTEKTIVTFEHLLAPNELAAPSSYQNYALPLDVQSYDTPAMQLQQFDESTLPSFNPSFSSPMIVDPSLQNDLWRFDQLLTQPRIYDGTLLDNMKWLHQTAENPILTNPTIFNPPTILDVPQFNEPNFSALDNLNNLNNSFNFNSTSLFDNR